MHFQPIRKNDDARFVPVVLVHDRDTDGAETMLRLRSIAWQRLKFNALLVCPSFTGAYAFLQNGTGYGPGADQQLIDALAYQTEVGEITDRMLVFGFGDGAQFAHRFTLQHPRRVAGCVALAGDSWTDPHGFCTGPMIKSGGFDEPPFDTDQVQAARKMACSEPTALPGVRWLLGGSAEAPEHLEAAEQFRGDLSRADSPVEMLTWSDESHRVPTPQMMTALQFFNDVVAQPAELPPAPATPVEPATAAEAADVEAETEAEAEAKEASSETKPPAEIEGEHPAIPADDEAFEVEVTAPAKPADDEIFAETFEEAVAAPAATPDAEPVVADATPIAEAEPEPTVTDAETPDTPDSGDSDAPMGHGRVEAVPAMTARERERMKPKPTPVKKKPGEGNGFFDQLLRQQNTEPGDGDS